MNSINKLVLLVTCIFFMYNEVDGQSLKTTNYVVDESIISNPERGIMVFTATHSSAYSFIDSTALKSYKENGISLIFRYFYIEKFANTSISQEYLNDMEQDFNTLRRFGFKAVIRFAYSESMSKPYGDAPLDVVLMQIDQLKPLFQKHADVILTLQAGFIGAWGEWYYTSNYSHGPGNMDASDWSARTDIVNAELEALPKTRMIGLRTTEYKQVISGSNTPLNIDEAYTGTTKARLGFHNDCFLADASDMGTYRDTLKDKPYQASDTRFSIIGGETCATSDYSVCSNSLVAMERFHWTYINQDYHPNVVGGWKSNGCWDVIRKKIGYRYKLISSKIQSSSKPGGSFEVNVKMINEGWANPVNPRKVELVLKNNSTNREYFITIPQDPRKWALHDTINLKITAGIANVISDGTYDIYLNMPDPELTLYNNPAYSIRMANKNVWVDSNGYNKLTGGIVISSSKTAPVYNGSLFFEPRKTVIAKPTIVVDGNDNDWSNIDASYVSDNQPANILKVYNTSDSVYFLIKGSNLAENFQLFIDADNDSTTGYKTSYWNACGADYYIDNKLIYRYIGNQWELTDSITLSQNSSAIEFRFNKASFADNFLYGFINNPNSDTNVSYIPSKGFSAVPTLFFLNTPLELKVTKYSNRALVYWAKPLAADVSIVLERSDDGIVFNKIGVFKSDICSYLDLYLNESTTYWYRAYCSNVINMSVATNSIETKTSAISHTQLKISIDGNVSDWVKIKPMAAILQNNSTYALRLANAGDSLYFSIEGNSINKYAVYFNSDNNTTTGFTLNTSLKGFDFLLRNDSLFNISAGKWLFKKRIKSENNLCLEGGCLLSDIGLGSINSCLVYCAVESGASKINFPTNGNWIFAKIITPVVPGYFTLKSYTSDPSSLYAIWQVSDDCNGYVVERSVNDDLNFQTLSDLNRDKYTYKDVNLNANANYFYRMFSYNEITRSDYTSILNSQSTAIGELSADITKLDIFPTILSDRAKAIIESKDDNSVTFCIYNAYGQLIKDFGKIRILAGKNSVDLYKTDFKSGIHIACVIDNKSGTYKKFVVK